MPRMNDFCSRLSRWPCALAALLLGLCLSTAGQAAPDFDDLDGVLLRNVRQGVVDYDGILRESAFHRFIVTVGRTDVAELRTPDEQLAFYLNAYNALAIKGILDGDSPASSAGRNVFFKRRLFQVAGEAISLESLEKEKIIPRGDARIHFAIVCASLSCPRLASRAWQATTLQESLDDAARRFINDGARNRFDTRRGVAWLSPIFDWYQQDFVRQAGSLQQYLAPYVADPATAERLRRREFRVEFVDYDWSLNGIHRGKTP
jgi:hypothetical protein